MSKFNFSEFGSQVVNSSPVQLVNRNKVAIGVVTAYVGGSTLAYVAAGVAVKAALAYSVGVATVYGAVIYGGYKGLQYLSSDSDSRVIEVE